MHPTTAPHGFPFAAQRVTPRLQDIRAYDVEASCTCGYTAWETARGLPAAKAALGRLIREHLASTGLALAPSAVTAR